MVTVPKLSGRMKLGMVDTENIIKMRLFFRKEFIRMIRKYNKLSDQRSIPKIFFLFYNCMKQHLFYLFNK